MITPTGTSPESAGVDVNVALSLGVTGFLATGGISGEMTSVTGLDGLSTAVDPPGWVDSSLRDQSINQRSNMWRMK